MVKDIKRYFTDDRRCFTNYQRMLSVKAMFRGAVIKKWVDCNEMKMDYHEHDKALVRYYA